MGWGGVLVRYSGVWYVVDWVRTKFQLHVCSENGFSRQKRLIV